MKKTISKRIKSTRELLNLKQEYVATKLSVSQQYYSKIESKSKNNFRIDFLEKIGDIFGVDYLFLITHEIPINNNTIETFKKNRISDFFVSKL